MTAVKDKHVLERLTVADYQLRLGERLDGSANMQMVWLADAEVTEEHLRAAAQRLNGGAFSRGVHKAKLPFARDLWGSLPAGPTYVLDAHVIADSSIDQWLLHQAEIEFDVTHEPGWRLTGANTEQGKSVISLVISHLITDGRGAINTVDKAAANELVNLTKPASAETSLVDDFLDLPRRANIAFSLLQRRLFRVYQEIKARSEHGLPKIQVPIIETFHVSLADLADKSGEKKGTITSLYIALAAKISVLLGKEYPNLTTAEEGSIVMPVDARGDSDILSNIVKIATVDVSHIDSSFADLAAIRAASKQAYSNASSRFFTTKISAMVSVAGAISLQAGDFFPHVRRAYARAIITSKRPHRVGNLSLYMFITTFGDVATLTFEFPYAISQKHFHELCLKALEFYGLTPLTS